MVFSPEIKKKIKLIKTIKLLKKKNIILLITIKIILLLVQKIMI